MTLELGDCMPNSSATSISGDTMPQRTPVTERIRKDFGKIRKIIDIPDLIGIQHESYDRFLQMDIPPDDRKDIGLQSVFNSVFPIKDFSGTASLEFVGYRFDKVKNSVKECVLRGMTYEISMRITVRLVVYDVDKETGVSNIRDIKEQEIYFGTIPLMTANGTFVINGTERVVVSQLHRSSGVFFDHDKGKSHSSGKIIYSSRIIPVRGSWIDMEIDPKDIVNVRIDRRRKFPITLLFKALGYTTEDLLDYFYDTEQIIRKEGLFYKRLRSKFMKGYRAGLDVFDPKTNKVLLPAGRLFTLAAIKRLKAAGVEWIPIAEDELTDKISATPIMDSKTGEILVQANEKFDEKNIESVIKAGVEQFGILFIDQTTTSDAIHKTLLLDKVETREEGLIEIYRRMRPGNPATPEVAQAFVDHLFFDSAYYDLSGVGRLKINQRTGIDTDIGLRTLRKEDILITAKTLVSLRDTQGAVDDIDHLGNRRVRAVGELLENQYRIGLVRMERAIKERMSLQEVDALMPHDLVNSKPVTAVVKEFFGTSQLSQFMDQTNPLSETTHKRRLSALGPGGLTRERAGFEVRDVHPSHYGRICPIETPEGPNIGLIVSLGTYARVNEYGFIETPYRIVKDSQVSNEVIFLGAFDEKDHPIAQANAQVDDENRFVNPLVTSRMAGEFTMVPPEQVEMMDISPNQLVSVSASLIPFLENDDANRALMGSNMQRQSVPLLNSQAPLVGTGIERVVAKDSGVTLVADRDGEVVDVEASRILIKHASSNGNGDNQKTVTIYNLDKFIRSNQNTCFNHRAIVQKGQQVKAGQIIADGPATHKGELALGKNVTVAFMPWGGYNYEDSILVGEHLVRDGVYTSVHIEEFELVARDTKLGPEEVTRDIPNVGEEALKDLDESGIIRLGAEVKSGDILVGKITPKTETQLSPEEKLLRAIFGEKAGDVKDSSLRVPPGVQGVVIDAKVFSRRGADKDERTVQIEASQIADLETDLNDQLAIVKEVAREHIDTLLVGCKCKSVVKRGKKTILAKDEEITKGKLAELTFADFEKIVLSDTKTMTDVGELLDRYRIETARFRTEFEKKVDQLKKGDDLLPGVIKMVKIYLAMKRTLSVGDKMAGRHGNKGVLSRILPQEDLPYFSDGTTVDMILNPLGVPSRMNVGQVLEIHLGNAARGLGKQIRELMDAKRTDDLREKMKRIFGADTDQDIAMRERVDDSSEDELYALANEYRDGVYMSTPVFDGAMESETKELLEEANYASTGQATLYDGRTGEAFKGKITVGAMYMLKLHHLVDDKIHARSIGPYSIVTQQPLGGKAQFGGQRLGEMEVWAMESYGAAHALQEFLTVKSDDMAGRTRMYEKIVKGQNVLEPGLPESFKVLTKELRALGLDVQLLED